MKSLVRLAALPAVAALLLAGCSSQAGPADPGGDPTVASSSSASGAEQSPQDGSTTVTITLGPDGKVDPNGAKLEAKVGDTLRFVITSDHDDEVHIHGIDLEIEVKAGETVTKEVTLDTPGSFEVESHHPAKTILILNVR